MKITFIQIEQAFSRCVMGESGRAVARSLGVDESALRFHWRKGVTPRYAREVAYALFHGEQARARLDADERAMVDRLVKRGIAQRESVTPRNAPAKWQGLGKGCA